MKRIGTTSLLLFCVWSLIFGQVPAWDWVKALYTNQEEVAYDVVADPVTGAHEDMVSFGALPPIQELETVTCSW